MNFADCILKITIWQIVFCKLLIAFCRLNFADWIVHIESCWLYFCILHLVIVKLKFLFTDCRLYFKNTFGKLNFSYFMLHISFCIGSVYSHVQYLWIKTTPQVQYLLIKTTPQVLYLWLKTTPQVHLCTNWPFLLAQNEFLCQSKKEMLYPNPGWGRGKELQRFLVKKNIFNNFLNVRKANKKLRLPGQF